MAKINYIHVGGPIFGSGCLVAILIMLQRDPRLIFNQWTWHNTQGTAISVVLGSASISGAGSTTSTVYFPELRYRFSVASNEYIGDRYGSMGPPAMSKVQVEELGAKIRANRDIPVDIYYDPKNPNRSYGYVRGVPTSNGGAITWYSVVGLTVYTAVWIPIGVWRTIKLHQRTVADTAFRKRAAKELARYRGY